MEVKFLILVILIIGFSFAPPAEGKRAFAIRMRAKSNSNSGRSISRKHNNQNVHHETGGAGGLVRNPPVSDTQPARPIGWDMSNSQPVGPPPAYPGLGHNAVPLHGAPPAYSPNFMHPPSYAEAVAGHHIPKIPPRGSYGSYGHVDMSSYHGLNGQHAYGGPSYVANHYPYGNKDISGGVYANQNQVVGGYGSNYGYQKSSPLSFGNVLTGLALWQVARGIGHHNHYNHYDRDKNPNDIIKSTLSPNLNPNPNPEFDDNPHIQVNQNFDFGAVLKPIPTSSTIIPNTDASYSEESYESEEFPSSTTHPPEAG